MLSWFKKRWKRKSAACTNSESEWASTDSGRDLTRPFYFELENSFIDLHHCYEVIPARIEKPSLQVTPLPQEFRQESPSFEVCSSCRKALSLDTLLTRDHSEPPIPFYQNTCTTLSPIATNMHGYDATHRGHCPDHVYAILTSEKSRLIFRRDTCIRRRPLPEPPLKQGGDTDVSDCESESSGFYETIDSDVDASFIGPWMSESILV
ncbi:hypothetical protein SNE40_017151 [Patella caerulea]|uniref:Uncharacterized protein n=1 Tax=Patella caerulea TaxID=87958 RepID=A0AAN8JEG1_PATCE